MVLVTRNTNVDETMPQTVPSAGFTPPCDYSNFAESFDLSLLPGGDQPMYPNPAEKNNPKIFTTFYPNSPEPSASPDFQTLLDDKKTFSNIYLEVPSSKNFAPTSPSGSLSPYSPNDQFSSYRQSSEANFYPSSPELSLYTPSPNSVYSRSPVDDFFNTQFIKKETPTYPASPYSPYCIKEESFLSPHAAFSSPTSPATSYSSLSSPEQINIPQSENADVLDLLESASVLDKQIKQESTVDFGNIVSGFQDSQSLRHLLESDNRTVPSKPKDHQLLREVLRDTSFQKKHNIKPIDFGFDFKMEEPDEYAQRDLMRENIEPVLNLAIEQLRKDVDATCAALGISSDPTQWSCSDVLSWLQWTSRQFGLVEPVPEQWDLDGANLAILSEDDFTRRSPQGGVLHAQLEIWKAACSDKDLSMNWLPDTASSNASSGDVSDDDDEEAATSQSDQSRPTASTSTRTGGSHIHLWQFLKELLGSPQQHGSCIRWLDRSKGIFKIEDSVKVARLWGKRKNRPAMNYDKLSRSIRQYYKKGIMKKTERSQRLVYQFCHPYNL